MKVSSLALVLLFTTSAASQAVEPANTWRDFQSTQGPGWTVEWSEATGTPNAIYGPGLRLGGAVASLEAARTESKALLNRFADLLGRGESNFVETIGVKVNKVYILVYDQEYKGLSVISGRADVRINDIGVVAMFGSHAVKIPAGFSLKPALAAIAAKAIAEDKILGQAAKARGEAPRLVIWANTEGKVRTTATLAWEVQIDERAAGSVQVGKVYVDATTGKVVQFKNEVLNALNGGVHVFRTEPARKAEKLAPVAKTSAAGAPMAALTGTVMGWVNLGHNPLDALVNRPIPNLRVTSSSGSAYTNAAGKFSIANSGTTAVTVSATLTGRHSKRVRTQTGTQMSASKSITPGTPGTIQLGTATMGELDRSQTTTYWFTDDCNVWFRGLLPGSTGPMNTLSTMNPRVNIPSSCNAYYTNFTINFYNQSSTCNMTAYETVVQHEWGHGADHAFGGLTQTDGLSEGWGDTLCTYRSAQPIVGPKFRKNGSSIRTALNTRTYPAGGGVHQQGQTWMGFNWDVRMNLIATHGSAAGIIIAEKIVIASIAADAKNQPNAVREVFILDDDDGNLNNGTPNYYDLEKAALKRTLPYPKKTNQNAGAYTTYGKGCPGTGKSSNACGSANAKTTANSSLTQNSNIFALAVAATTGQRVVAGFELFTQRLGGSGSITINTQIYWADSTGKPTGAPVKTGTMTIGSTQGWYKTTFTTPLIVAANRKFFLSYTSVSGQMKFPIGASGTKVSHFWHSSSSTSWNGTAPNGFITQAWAWKVNCATNTGAIPVLSNTGVPELNSSFKVHLSSARNNAPALFLIGFSDTVWGSIPLPWDLAPLGAVGCKLFASGELIFGFTTSATGTFTHTLGVPNDNSLLGLKFYNQHVIDEPTLPFGLVLGNAGAGKIGK